MTDATTRYVVACVLVATFATISMAAQAGLPPVDLGAVALYVLAVALTDRTELVLRFERETVGFSLLEVAITAGLFLMPLGWVVPATAAGVVLAQFRRRLEVRKGAFNVATASIGTAGAALITQFWPVMGPMIAQRPVLGVLVGMLGFVAVNGLMMTGLLLRVAGDPVRETIRDRLPLTATTMIGTTAVGVVVAALWTTQPELVVFAVAPAAAIYLAARGALRSQQLLTEMRAEHDRLERVVDGASDGILLLDHTGTVQVWNAAMTRMTGIPIDDAVGHRIPHVLTDRVRDAAVPVRDRWLIDQAHDRVSQQTLEARLTDDTGVTRDVRESHALVFDERGRCTGDVVIVRDVSRQLELERLRSDFVARVSHELRTPLTPIRGFAAVLLRRWSELATAQRQEALERIVERTDHLSELVEDLLLVTRLDRREFDELVHPRPTDLGAVVRSCTERLVQAVTDRRITVDVAPATPAALADPDRVRQILDALLDNATRYTPAGTPIEVVVDQSDDDVRVRVTDHGPGVPNDKREVIFEQFQRLEDPLTMRTGGVGLGLFIAQRLAQAMHGGLTMGPSRPGAGAEFVLRLPTAEPVESSESMDVAG